MTMEERMRAALDRGIGQMLGAAGHRVMHWRHANPDTPDQRLNRWRERFAMRVDAEEADRRACAGARLKRAWWLRFKTRDMERDGSASNVTPLRRRVGA